MKFSELKKKLIGKKKNYSISGKKLVCHSSWKISLI